MVTATHTPQPTRGPKQGRAGAPIGADALMMRPASIGGLDSEDPLSDVMIGGRDDLRGDRGDAVSVDRRRGRPARTGTRPAWVPIGAAAAAILAIVAVFFFMRGAPIEVTSGAQGHEGASSPAANPSAPGAGSGAGAATGSAPVSAPSATGGSSAYPDTSKGGGPEDGGKASAANAASANTPPANTPSANAGEGAGVGANAAPGANAGAGSTPPAAPSVHVMLTGSYPFEVSSDGGVLSRARTRHDLQLAGPRTLRLRAPEYGLDRRIDVNGKPGETVRLSAPALGRLTVRTTFETCQIFLGGLALGYPPLAERPVASGTYRLTLRCPDGDHQTQTVTIPAGATYMALIQ